MQSNFMIYISANVEWFKNALNRWSHAPPALNIISNIRTVFAQSFYIPHAKNSLFPSYPCAPIEEVMNLSSESCCGVASF